MKRLCTKNTSWALIERPYSCAPQAVGAVYDRPGFFVQSPGHQGAASLITHFICCSGGAPPVEEPPLRAAGCRQMAGVSHHRNRRGGKKRSCRVARRG